MRYAVISDIHSNLQAFRAVLRRLEDETIDEYICLGDIVGYGADPNKCVELVRTLTDKVIAGNHDHAAVGLTDISYFNPYARQAAIWTAEQLYPENRDYLKQLPLILSVYEPYTDPYGKAREYIFVHSTPKRPELWHYILSPYQALSAFDEFKGSVLFIGHSHQPVTFVKEEEGLKWTLSDFVKIAPGVRYIINVGSIGQPRDGDPRSSFSIFDTDKGEVEILRVEYDISAAQAAIRSAGLPQILADRLGYGQ